MRATNNSAQKLVASSEKIEVLHATVLSEIAQHPVSTTLDRYNPSSLAPPSARLAAPKILLYSHDTFGLGNIRRTLLLTQELTRQYAGAAILIITGSPMIHAFRIPEGIDYIKLPCLDRVDAERYEPRFLSDCSAEVKRTRSVILKDSVLAFDPDLMIVDKRPAGVDGELLETLEAVRQRRRTTKLVLGLRDILDDPERTRVALKNNQSFETIDRFYDEVWIYGSPSIFDHVKEYDFPESVARKTFYCGYLKRTTEPSARTNGPPRVLVTTGGGGDGRPMIEAYLEGLAALPRNVALQTTVIFGPQMQETRRHESTVFDNNIERDVVAVRSYGLVPSLGFNYQNDSSKNPVEIDYEAAFHSYTNTDKWDRVSHAMSMSYGRRLSRRFRARSELEVSFKGDSEDRDLDNRYTISQRLEYRPFSTSRLQAFAAYRIKRDPADPRNNAISPYFGGKLIQRLGVKRSFELGYRYESNRTEDPTGRYIRWKYEGQFTTPFLSRGLLTVGASYRPSLYQRTIRVDRVRVVRKDRRWDFDAKWERPLNENLRLELFYELDTRNSNDVRKIFTAHSGGMSLTYQWQR